MQALPDCLFSGALMEGDAKVQQKREMIDIVNVSGELINKSPIKGLSQILTKELRMLRWWEAACSLQDEDRLFSEGTEECNEDSEDSEDGGSERRCEALPPGHHGGAGKAYRSVRRVECVKERLPDSHEGNEDDQGGANCSTCDEGNEEDNEDGSSTSCPSDEGNEEVIVNEDDSKSSCRSDEGPMKIIDKILEPAADIKKDFFNALVRTSH